MSIRKFTVAAIVALSVACSAGPTANVTTDADVTEGTLTVTETPACTAEQKAECAAKCEAARAACDASKKAECTGGTEDESSDA